MDVYITLLTAHLIQISHNQNTRIKLLASNISNAFRSISILKDSVFDLLKFAVILVYQFLKVLVGGISYLFIQRVAAVPIYVILVPGPRFGLVQDAYFSCANSTLRNQWHEEGLNSEPYNREIYLKYNIRSI